MALNLTSESPFASGVEQGTGIFQKLIQPYMQAQQMAREYQQHQQSLAQQYKMHMDELPGKNLLRDAQMQDALASAQEKQMMLNLMKSGDTQQGRGMPSSMSAVPQQNVPSYMDSTGQQEQSQLDITKLPQAWQDGLGGVKQELPLQDNQQQQQYTPADLEYAPIGSKAIIDAGNPALYNLDNQAGIGKIPKLIEHTNPVTGNTIITYPSGKRVETKLAPSQMELAKGKSDLETDAARNREIDKYDIKWAGELREQSKDTTLALDSYNALEGLLNTPTWQNLKKGLVQKYGPEWMRRKDINMKGLVSDQEAGDIIGQIQTLSGDIIAKNAKLFSGPFRIAEQKLLESMKPQPTDPINIQLGKLKQMKRLGYLQSLVDEKVSTMILEDGVRGSVALRKVKEELGINQTLEGYKKEFLEPMEKAEKEQTVDFKSVDFNKMSAKEYQDYINKLPVAQRIKLLEASE